MNIDQPPHHPHHHFHHVPSSSFSCSCSQSFPPININICHDFYGYHIFLKSFFCIRFIYVFFSMFYHGSSHCFTHHHPPRTTSWTRRTPVAASRRHMCGWASARRRWWGTSCGLAEQWPVSGWMGNHLAIGAKKSNLAEIHLSRIDF